MEQTAAKKIRPALYKFDGMPWGWVSLASLAEIIGKEPHSLWQDYFNLSKDAPAYDTLTVAINGEMIPLSKAAISCDWEPTSYLDEVIAGTVYVPAGWANDVLDCHASGIHTVVHERHQHLKHDYQCPEGTISCSFNGMDFDAAVGMDDEVRVVVIPRSVK